MSIITTNESRPKRFDDRTGTWSDVPLNMIEVANMLRGAVAAMSGIDGRHVELCVTAMCYNYGWLPREVEAILQAFPAPVAESIAPG